MFGSIKIHIQGLGDLVGEAAATDAEHLGPLNAAVVNHGNVGGAAADVHHDRGEIAIQIIT